MNKELVVTKTIIIKVKPEKVWHALIDRETIKKYFFGTEAISEWKVGSTLIFQGEWNGKAYQDKGNILAAEPVKFLQYNYWSAFSGLEDTIENYSLVTYRLDDGGAETTLHLSQEGFADEEAKSHGESGWTMVLDNLKKLLESG